MRDPQIKGCLTALLTAPKVKVFASARPYRLARAAAISLSRALNQKDQGLKREKKKKRLIRTGGFDARRTSGFDSLWLVWHIGNHKEAEESESDGHDGVDNEEPGREHGRLAGEAGGKGKGRDVFSNCLRLRKVAKDAPSPSSESSVVIHSLVDCGGEETAHDGAYRLASTMDRKTGGVSWEKSRRRETLFYEKGGNLRWYDTHEW